MSESTASSVQEATARIRARRLGADLDAARSLEAMRRGKRLTFELLRPAPGDRLLDLGCGTGDDVIELAALVGATGLAAGVDADPRLIDEAERRRVAAGARADFRVAEGDALPYGPASFRGCRAEQVLVHAAAPVSIVAELFRVTEPGGSIVLAEPDWGTLVLAGAAPESTERMRASLIGRFARPEIGRTLPELLRGAGCRDVEVHGQVATFTDLASAELVLRLEAGLAHATASGAIGRLAAERWWEQLRAADGEGRFFAALTGFVAVGRRGRGVGAGGGTGRSGTESGKAA